MNGVLIKYGDIAPGAKEAFTASSEDRQFDTLGAFNRDSILPNFANPCEKYQTLLDGVSSPVPDNIGEEDVAFWSKRISNDDGVFCDDNGEPKPVKIEFKSDQLYSSQGISLSFDDTNNIFANNITITWSRESKSGTTSLVSDSFFPDNAYFFCPKQVERYNKLTIEFKSINMPKNRLKVKGIDYGRLTSFSGKELKNVKIIQELDPISTSISINTADFVLESKSDIDYSFQVKQALSIYFGGKLISTNFVKNSKRKSKSTWDVKTEDYIGLMDSIPFSGGMYTGEEAGMVIQSIFESARIPYELDEILIIDEESNPVKLYGYIPYTSCREALMQVAFAIGAVVDTSRSDKVRIYELNNDSIKDIPLGRIMQGQSFTEEETVTAVELTEHKYVPTSEVVFAYDAEKHGTGKNIFVKFSEPLFNVQIFDGELSEFGTNYAIIKEATESTVLSGQKYKHIKVVHRKDNELILASDIEKVVAVENATLVHAGNVDKLLQMCYNELTKTRSTKMKLVERRNDEVVNVGDSVKYETEYMGTKIGRVIKQTFNLNGGMLVKDTTVR